MLVIVKRYQCTSFKILCCFVTFYGVPNLATHMNFESEWVGPARDNAL